MNTSAIFLAAHTTAKATRNNFATYRAAFAAALKAAYAAAKAPAAPAITKYTPSYKGGITYKQLEFLRALDVTFTGFRSTTQLMKCISVYEASDLIGRAKAGEKIEVVY